MGRWFGACQPKYLPIQERKFCDCLNSLVLFFKKNSKSGVISPVNGTSVGLDRGELAEKEKGELEEVGVKLHRASD